MMATYYRKARGALLLFSATDLQSFIDCEKWRLQLMENAVRVCGRPRFRASRSLSLSHTLRPPLRQEPDVRVILIRNKVDCPADTHVVLQETARDYAKKHGMLFMDTSAKTDLNVKRAFQDIVADVHKQWRRNRPRMAGRTESVDLKAARAANSTGSYSGVDGCC